MQGVRSLRLRDPNAGVTHSSTSHPGSFSSRSIWAPIFPVFTHLQCPGAKPFYGADHTHRPTLLRQHPAEHR
jgi:hypothetical protein